jgi:restriction system protein
MHVAPGENHRTSIGPAEYEKVVVELLFALGRDLTGFRVQHQETIRAPDGSFRIDATVRFTQLGVDFLVLVECKDHARPVERADVQVLADKLRASGAHKGMLFSTNGFQKGAVEYACAHGIALIQLLDGELTYETKAQLPPGAPRPKPPPWANIPRFVGIVNSLDADGRWLQSLLEPQCTESLVAFLVGSA